MSTTTTANAPTAPSTLLAHTQPPTRPRRSWQRQHTSDEETGSADCSTNTSEQPDPINTPYALELLEVAVDRARVGCASIVTESARSNTGQPCTRLGGQRRCGPEGGVGAGALRPVVGRLDAAERALRARVCPPGTCAVGGRAPGRCGRQPASDAAAAPKGSRPSPSSASIRAREPRWRWPRAERHRAAGGENECRRPGSCTCPRGRCG